MFLLGLVEDVFEDSKNVILSDNKRLEMSRKLREVDRILAGLSNTTEIFGFEKTEMYRKLNKVMYTFFPPF